MRISNIRPVLHIRGMYADKRLAAGMPHSRSWQYHGPATSDVRWQEVILELRDMYEHKHRVLWGQPW